MGTYGAEMRGHKIGEHVSPRVRDARRIGNNTVNNARHKLGEWRSKIAEKQSALRESIANNLAPLPSEEFERYGSLLLSGTHEGLKFDPNKVMAVMDFYGKEDGRFRLMSGNREVSFYVTTDPSGAHHIQPEVVVEFDGKI